MTYSIKTKLPSYQVKYFDDKIKDIKESLPRIPTKQCEEQTVTPACSLTNFVSATEEEVEKLVSASPPKSCTLDPVPTWLMKACKDLLVPMVTKIINASLMSSIVPETMKLGIITPLIKKPDLDPEILKNYRPVSNLSFVSKILEKIVARRIKDYMTANNLHDCLQSAYKAYHSTETALLKVQNDILCSLDKQGVTVLVLLDLSAAFDTIDHSTLLSRIQTSLGITGPALEWIRSYLTSRKQAVRINGTTSDAQSLDCGVPQGSVLGPLLFLAYILPLGVLIKSYGLHMHGYADDTQIYVTLPKPSDQHGVQNCIVNLENCLSDVHAWMSQNKLKLNAAKTEIILLGPKKDLSTINITTISVAGTPVSVSLHPIRNLGAILDPQLNMASHVNNTVKTANYHLRNVGRVRQLLTIETAKQVIQSLVISRLDYCNSLLAGTPTSLIEKLQHVQNKAARIITKTRKHDHITPVLKDLHWLPVRCRINFKILLLVFKALRGSHSDLGTRAYLYNLEPAVTLMVTEHSVCMLPDCGMPYPLTSDSPLQLPVLRRT
jgi:hypothetical protein